MKKLLQCFCLCLSVLTVPLRADMCKVQTWLSATAEMPEAVCKVSLSLAKSRSALMLNAQGLPPMGAYQVKVDGIERGSFNTNSQGAGMYVFYAPSLASRPKLDFEPRGKHIQIFRSDRLLLSGVLSGQGEHGQSEVTDAALLDPVSAKQGSRAAVTFHRTKQGGSSFNIAVSGVTDDPLQVLLQGHEVGVIQPHAGQGVLLMRSGQAKAPWSSLTQDPRGKGIDLLQAGKLLFSGRVLAKGQGVNLSQPTNLQLPMQKTALAGQASGRAEFIMSSHATQDFRLQLRDLASGSYDLLVSGVPVVAFETRSPDTLLNFSSLPMLEQRLLTFSPLGAELRVQRGNEVYLSLFFQPELLQTMPKPEPAMQLTEQLTSTGASSVAEAVASYEVDRQGAHALQVKLLHAPAGIYRLRVGHVVRGIIRCAGSSADTTGHTEFRTVPEPGKLLLNFDPRGQTVEILDLKGSVFFQHGFGSGSARLEDRVVTPEEWLLPMLAEKEAQGSAEMEYHRTRHGEWFCLSLKNVAEGRYEVRVAGQPWHEFQVSGTSAKVELASQAKDKALQWSVSPAAQTISLWHEGKLGFQRKLGY